MARKARAKEESAATATNKGRIDIEAKLKLLREAGIEMVGEDSQSEADSSEAGLAEKKARESIERKLKLLREAGIPIVGEEPSDFGGITIIGAPMPPPDEADESLKR